MAASVIVRVLGGLGNQLFCYAAARRLALRNNVALKIDARSGFRCDKFERKYLLRHFNISAHEASRWESFDGVSGETRRRIVFRLSKILPYNLKPYLVEDIPGADLRLQTRRVVRDTYLDGLWQSERYFEDIGDVIRRELAVPAPAGAYYACIAAEMGRGDSVAVHVRSYKEVSARDASKISPEYYERAIALMTTISKNRILYCFSDDLAYAKALLSRHRDVVYIRNDEEAGSNGPLGDLWLMTKCRHHIIANSTFSWWGAWLCAEPDRQKVVAPKQGAVAANPNWIPLRWIGL